MMIALSVPHHVVLQCIREWSAYKYKLREQIENNYRGIYKM